MLSYFFLKQSSVNYVKNNFYLDYGLKFAARSFTYSTLIQLSFFFAEKYIIEYYTRYSFNYLGLASNSMSFKLSHSYMYVYLVLFASNVIAVLV